MVKKLIKHPQVVEECETKCVPEKVLVPACPPCLPCPPCGTIYHGQPVIVAPSAPAKPASEPLPPPKTEQQ